MSWYLFKNVPSVQHRGIKVQGFEDMHRPKLTLSWGINQQSNISQSYQQDKNTVPPTIVASKSVQVDNVSNIKLLTETSEDDSQQLGKLIKDQKEQRRQQNIIQRAMKLKNRGYSLANKKEEENRKARLQKEPKYFQIDKRIRYLENSLLPVSRRDNMGSIFNHAISREGTLQQSRISGKSCYSKKNESSIVLGNGYNVYFPLQQPKKDLTQKFKEMYEYDEIYKKRIDGQSFKLG